MAQKQFNDVERSAIFYAHSDTNGMCRCWLCDEPVELSVMDVDHILPENLSGEPDLLKDTLRLFGLPENFELNSFANWLPSHRKCNGKKSSHIFRPTPLIQIIIDRTSADASRVQKIYEKGVQAGVIDRAVAALSTHSAVPRHLIDQLVQYGAQSNTTTRQIGTKIVTGPPGTTALAIKKPIYRYVPPKMIQLAPGVTALFDATPVDSPLGPFKYTIVDERDLRQQAKGEDEGE